MPKGKGIRKKSNVADFIRYAQEHNYLNPKQIYERYKETSEYGIQKTKALDIMRQIFGYEKNEKKGSTVQEKTNQTKAHEYVNPAKQTSTYHGKGKQEGSNNYIKLSKKYGVNYYDTKNPSVRMLKSKIENMFGYSTNSFIEVVLTIEADGYTQHNVFSVWIPFNGREKQGVKSMGQKLIANLKSFYSRLASRYTTDVRIQAKKDDMLERLEDLRKDLNRSRGLQEDDLKELFAHYGISIDTITLTQFTHNERVEGSTRWKNEHKE